MAGGVTAPVPSAVVAWRRGWRIFRSWPGWLQATGWVLGWPVLAALCIAARPPGRPGAGDGSRYTGQVEVIGPDTYDLIAMVTVVACDIS